MATDNESEQKFTTSGIGVNKDHNQTETKAVQFSQVQVNEELTEMAKRTAKQHKKWNRRLKIFFCCLGYKKNKVSKQ